MAQTDSISRPSRMSAFAEQSAREGEQQGGDLGGGGEQQQTPRRKKPSYVGLSCAVSGYTFNRYTSPDGRRTSPSQIPVSSPPQTLDSVNLLLNMRGDTNGLNGHDMTDRAAYVTVSSSRRYANGQIVETTSSSTRYYGSREDSPLSDSSEGGGAPTLVQKQIERLYGGRITSVTSPDREVNGGSEVAQKKNSGGFFAKRFGISKKDRSTEKDEQKKNDNGTSPLDFKPLKVPAVFRLLRPEFREQLKSNSCQIPNEQTSPSKLASKSKERLIPIQTETSNGAEDIIPKTVTVIQTTNGSKERIIPIEITKKTHEENEKEESSVKRSPVKPALPAKPLSPPPPKPHDVTSPALVSQVINTTNNNVTKSSPVREPEPIIIEKEPEVTPSNGHGEAHAEVAELEPVHVDEEDVIEEYESVGGVHQPVLLHTILEEDNESTASGSQLSLARTNSNNNANNAQNVDPAVMMMPEKEVHDGHYFIKLIENETFKFEEHICDFEDDVSDSSIPDDVRDSILAAVGKAKLLMAQKLAQFRGLCDKNIAGKAEDDPFVPTSEDLAGFWDMVYIQVEHIHALFEELRELKKNGWKKPEKLASPATNTDKSSPKPRTAKKSPGSKKNSPSGASPSPKKPQSEAAKARDEARKKMLEQKKKMMRQKQQEAKNNSNGDENGIFVQF